MSRLRLIAWLACFVSGCDGHNHGSASEGEHAHPHEDERPALSFTHWTEQSELFIELPALVRGQESACAAHATKLPSFDPIAAGSVTVVLRGPNGDERFESRTPSLPGIFRPLAKPTASGVRRLLVEIRGDGVQASHDLGEVTVYDSIAAAKKAIPEQPEAPGRIAFLKEQQWPIEFGTALVAERNLRPSLRAMGRIRARSNGEVTVSAPVAGRVASSEHGFPQLGQRVVANDLLAVLAPRLEAADLASLDLAVKSGALELGHAEGERERLRALRTEGAVPERRALEAEHAAEEARAALSAAQSRLDQFRRIDRTAGRGESTVQLRAPLSGTITGIDVAPGAFVEAGVALWRVTDLTQLWLEAYVPEVDAGRLAAPGAVSLSIDGSDQTVDLPAESLVTRSRVIDPVSRTLSIFYALDNASARFAVGAFCRLRLINGPERSALALPEAALVDDSGVSVVFVQIEGESFERRPVRLGIRDAGYVEIVQGLRAGEHVVTRGAWSVKLAASSGAVPAHGHAH